MSGWQILLQENGVAVFISPDGSYWNGAELAIDDYGVVHAARLSGTPGSQDMTIQGPPGVSGQDSLVPGPQGETGPQGIQGFTGYAGAPGSVFSFKSGWQANESYEIGDVVQLGNDMYQAVLESTGAENSPLIDQSPEVNPWNKIYIGAIATGPQGIQGETGQTGATGSTGQTGAASTVAGPQGIQGEPGVSGFNMQGAWNSATEYVPGDIVQSGTSLYKALVTTTGEDPSATPLSWFVVYSGS